MATWSSVAFHLKDRNQFIGWDAEQCRRRLHHCLDITLREDESRVRRPKVARILGTIRRIVVSLANAAVNKDREKNPNPNTTPALSRIDSNPLEAVASG